MNLQSVPKPPAFPGGTPEDWASWALHRLQSQPWALGGAVVMSAFFLVFIVMLVFSLAFGCCCSASGRTRKTIATTTTPNYRSTGVL